MAYFGILQNFALSFGTEFHDIMEVYRALRNLCNSAPNKIRINRNSSQKNLYPGFYPNRDYLLRQYQRRDGFSKRTRICQYQKGMLIRMNKEIRGLERKIGENTREAFSKK